MMHRHRSKSIRVDKNVDEEGRAFVRRVFVCSCGATRVEVEVESKVEYRVAWGEE